MKVIAPSYSIFDLESDLDPLRKIEKCGRVCYQSTHKIEDQSYQKFVGMIMKNGHYSVLEHGNIILEIIENDYNEIVRSIPAKALKFFAFSDDDRLVMSGNFRAWIELIKEYEGDVYAVSKIKEFLSLYFPDCFDHQYRESYSFYDIELLNFEHLSKEEFYTHQRITVDFIADRGFLAEIRTHRDASFSAESTRYCNYASDKFNNELTMIMPLFFANNEEAYTVWESSCRHIEMEYFKLLENGASPQEARTVLPNSLKAEIVMTANIPEWEHVFKLRTSTGAHPQMKELMIPLEEDFHRKGYL